MWYDILCRMFHTWSVCILLLCSLLPVDWKNTWMRKLSFPHVSFIILKGKVKFNQGKYWIFSDILAWLTSLKNTYYQTLPQEESYQILQKQQITVVSTVRSVFPFLSVTIHVKTLVPMVHNVISLTGIVVALLGTYWNHEKRKKNCLTFVKWVPSLLSRSSNGILCHSCK